MRSTSPSSGVRNLVRVCRRAVAFFGDAGLDAAEDDAVESSAAVATSSSFTFGDAAGGVVEMASLADGLAALADLLLLLREMEALDAVK